MSIEQKPRGGTAAVQRPLRGILLYTLAFFLIVVMNTFAKMASEYHTAVETVFYRGLIGLPLLLALAAWRGRLAGIAATTRLKSHVGRAIAGNIGVVMVFWSYSLLPLADVTALLFASPLLVTILSAVLLKESVGVYRWLAVVTGFVGVVLIAQPTGQDYPAHALLVVLAAIFSTALVQIFLRDLGKTEDALTTVFYFLVFGILFTGIYMIFKGTLPHETALIPLAGAGIAGLLQLIIKTEALRMAEASLLSPFTYTSIIWATLFGWLFWDHLPTLPVIAGAAIVVASNLFILWREKVKSKLRPVVNATGADLK